MSLQSATMATALSTLLLTHSLTASGDEPIFRYFTYEQAPSITRDLVLYFSSAGPDGLFDSLWRSELRIDGWTEPNLDTALSSIHNDIHPFISHDGAVIFFSSDRVTSHSQIDPESGLQVQSYDIYWSAILRGEWTPPKPIPGRVNNSDDQLYPVLSRDRSTLYYTLLPARKNSRPILMRARFHDGNFIDPLPMPLPINSGHGEKALMPSGKHGGYFFSSQRPGGYGGYDIWFIPHEWEKLGEVIHLGPAVNSNHNEERVAHWGEELYISSDRSGEMRIYKSSDYTIAYDLRLQIRNRENGEPLSVEAEVKAGRGIGIEGLAFAGTTLQSNAAGELIVPVHPSLRQLKIEIMTQGYLPHEEQFEVTTLLKGESVIELTPIRRDESITLHNIQFAFNSSQIERISLPFLDRLVEFMKRNPEVQFRVIGHTDRSGSQAYNARLSLQRAASVRDYLISQGIEHTRFEIEGRGKLDLLSEEKTPEADSLNRRTEFRILSNGNDS